MRNYVIISFTSLFILVTSESCDKCVKREECTAYGNLSKKDQDSWDLKYPCEKPKDTGYGPIYGFHSVAKGDYICCSNGIGTPTTTAPIAAEGISVGSRANYNRYGPQNNYNGNNYYPNSQSPNYGYNKPNSNDWPSDNNWLGNNGYGQGDPYGYQNGGNRPPKNYFNTNNNPYVTSSPFFPVHGHGNGDSNLGGQCPVTRLPPNPETGCCGREASESDRIIGRQPKPPPYNNGASSNLSPGNGGNPNSYDNSGWPSWSPGFDDFKSPVSRVARSAEEPVQVTVGDRIAGGRETELEQFPWTVLLQVTFDYGDRRAAFNCGGSLISSRYVLTAGHCVFDQGGKILDIDIYLAEYDKTTFPKDCKIVLGQGKKCIENVVMKAEKVVLHPEYDDTRLNNDIALIRLLGDAPYTDYIRPICLPTIDIDSPEFFNLHLAVAGWGRNGKYRSNIKQSTIVNLVNQEKCKNYYPNLSRRQMCAAGYTGEDTCKGDSGGPLMTVYGGKYEVVGVVSGKRADSPCGTSVPSLYTNVYHYRDWIRSNMKEN